MLAAHSEEAAMKLVRIYCGDDGESHVETIALDLSAQGGTRTVLETARGIEFVRRDEGSFLEFHIAPRLQYVLYLTASVEIGMGDGTTLLMEPGDVLRAEDNEGHGHSSRVVQGGMCAIVPIGEG